MFDSIIYNMYNVIKGFTIFGLNVKFYGILMALAMLVGILLACKNSKERELKSDDIFALALIILPMAVIGARLLYVLGASHTYSFLEVFKIWEGGMSIYGGIIGGAIGIALYCLIFKKNFLNVADVACVSLILGQAIGRWGNFFNQEVYGEIVTNTSLQWFPFAVLLDNGEWHYALFFYEFLINLAIFSILLLLLKKTKTKGYVTSAYLVSYGTIRFILEPLRVSDFNLMIWGLKLSSITSVLAILAGIVIFVFVYTNQKRSKNFEKE